MVSFERLGLRNATKATEGRENTQRNWNSTPTSRLFEVRDRPAAFGCDDFLLVGALCSKPNSKCSLVS